MKLALWVVLGLVVIYLVNRVGRIVGGLFGTKKSRPSHGGLGGGTHQDNGDADRPRRPRHGGF